ncbi:unnamed protein product [Acanthoscelides obtectus]|nr:unnamed protein product [Acanthoscelides obtectus]
MSIKRLS